MTITFRMACAAAVLAVGGSVRAQNPFEPTAEHKMLAEDVGTWDAEVKMWAQGPEADPDVSKASEVVTAVGDFWTVADFKGQMMGQPFAGHGIYGYDAAEKKFTAVWVDTMSLEPIEMEGTYDPKSKELTMYAEGFDPGTKAKYKMKQVAVSKDKDHRMFTMYVSMPGGGDELVKMMEVSYTRKK